MQKLYMNCFSTERLFPMFIIHSDLEIAQVQHKLTEISIHTSMLKQQKEL